MRVNINKIKATFWILLSLSIISKLKKIQSSFINFFKVPFSKKCELLTLIGRDFLSHYIPLNRREMTCFSALINVIYSVEIVKVLRATLCSFYRYRNLWSSWVSVKPHTFSRRSTYSTILKGGFYGFIN